MLGLKINAPYFLVLSIKITYSKVHITINNYTNQSMTCFPPKLKLNCTLTINNIHFLKISSLIITQVANSIRTATRKKERKKSRGQGKRSAHWVCLLSSSKLTNDLSVGLLLPNVLRPLLLHLFCFFFFAFIIT